MASKLHVSQKEKRIITLIGILFIGYIAYTFVYLPLSREKKSVQDKITLTKSNLRKNLKLIEKAKRESMKYKKISENFTQKGSDEEVRSNILSQIEKMTQRVSIRIADLKPRAVKKINFYKHFSVSLAIEGEFLDILLFVYLAQNPPYSFDIDDFQMRKKSSRGETLRCLIVFSRKLIP